MPTWNALVDEFNATPVGGRSALMTAKIRECVAGIAAHRNSSVVCYASGSLQKPQAPPFSTQITREDVRGFIAGIRVSELFASDEHGSRGRQIGRDAARDEGVTVDDLGNDQSLQEVVLTLYHWSTIAFEHGPVAKSLISNTTPLQRRRRKNCHYHRCSTI